MHSMNIKNKWVFLKYNTRTLISFNPPPPLHVINTGRINFHLLVLIVINTNISNVNSNK